MSFSLFRCLCVLVDSRVPWVGAGVGIILGVIIVIADQLLTKSPAVKVIINIQFGQNFY